MRKIKDEILGEVAEVMAVMLMEYEERVKALEVTVKKQDAMIKDYIVPVITTPSAIGSAYSGPASAAIGTSAGGSITKEEPTW